MALVIVGIKVQSLFRFWSSKVKHNLLGNKVFIYKSYRHLTTCTITIQYDSRIGSVCMCSVCVCVYVCLEGVQALHGACIREAKRIDKLIFYDLQIRSLFFHQSLIQGLSIYQIHRILQLAIKWQCYNDSPRFLFSKQQLQEKRK